MRDADFTYVVSPRFPEETSDNLVEGTEILPCARCGADLAVSPPGLDHLRRGAQLHCESCSQKVIDETPGDTHIHLFTGTSPFTWWAKHFLLEAEQE